MRKNHIEKLSHYVLNKRPWFIHLFHAVLVLCSLSLAWLLRFDFSLPDRRLLFWGGFVLIAIRLVSLSLFNLHRGWWRYAGLRDGLDILFAVSLGSVIFWGVATVVPQLHGFPKSIYFLEGLFTCGALVAVRLLSRVFAESVRRDVTNSSKRVILIGAGFAAQMIIRELSRPQSGLEVVGCVDDDESKRGIRLHGVPVLGTVAELASVLVNCPSDEILIAVPSATGKQMQRFTEACVETGLRFRTVPTLRDIIDGHVTIREFRDVDLDDLLGRQPIEIDVEFVRQQIERRIVLVTGAAGSIGSELCRQIANFHPAKLICLDQSETGIFYLQRDLQEVCGLDRIYCVADVGNRERMQRIFAEHRPQIIFHAAAYKHVPIMEVNVEEAVSNNVLALLDLLDVAEEFGTQNLVLISSDKAVNPNNVMGATKRIGELLLASRPSNSLCCVSVRFGNVLGSSGSVVPIFQEQLRLNQPLTITHREVSRFFMTTAEAVSLVLQAFALGEHGDILVLDMGEPVRILDLARTLIRLTGKNEDEAQIRFTGLRKGEKLSEELFYATEEVVDTRRPKVRRARGFQQNWSLLNRQIADLKEALTSHHTGHIRENLRKIVPEYIFEANCDDVDFEPVTRQELHRSARQV